MMYSSSLVDFVLLILFTIGGSSLIIFDIEDYDFIINSSK